MCEMLLSINPEHVQNIFAGVKKFAYHLGKIVKYSEPKDLEDYGIGAAPQSFVYVESEEAVS